MKHNIAEFIFAMDDGGAETLVKDYALMLDKNKFNLVCIVVRQRYNTANSKVLEEHGIRIIPIYKSNQVFSRIVQKFNQWWYPAFRLKRILKKEKIEVLHAHLYVLKYISQIRQSIRNVRLIYTCHNIPERFLGGINGASARKLLRDNDMKIIALHDDMCKEIDAILDIDSTLVIENGIDFKRFKDVQTDKKEIRKMFGIPLDAFVVGHVGRFVDQKNHSFLIKIFDELCRRREDAFLLLVGAGELLNQTVQDIENLGLQNRYLILSHRSDIPELMKAMDVFVFPSKFEGLGIVLVEAQVSGLKCVVSDAVPGEVFLTEQIIKVSLSDSVTKWCDVILDSSIKGMPNGRLKNYDMNQVIKKLEKLYLNTF